ncbi:MAG: 50S ribosomal protein L10 [Candidatus Gastranaerophilales bacterium]|nr:50S ribosomal protein L10 [Candidatus Gastranaerophilales bacterium]
MATKAFKEEKLQTVKDSVSKAKVAIATDYKGLSVEEITKLRRALQKEGAEFTVVKNTLAKIAIEGTDFAPLAELLQGTTALAFGFQDEVSPAKIIEKFIKETKKAEIKGGVLDGKVLSVEQVQELAKLPSKEELYAKMLGCINSPASGIANCVNGVLTALVRAMDQVREQKESA